MLTLEVDTFVDSAGVAVSAVTVDQAAHRGVENGHVIALIRCDQTTVVSTIVAVIATPLRIARGVDVARLNIQIHAAADAVSTRVSRHHGHIPAVFIAGTAVRINNAGADTLSQAHFVSARIRIGRTDTILRAVTSRGNLHVFAEAVDAQIERLRSVRPGLAVSVAILLPYPPFHAIAVAAATVYSLGGLLLGSFVGVAASVLSGIAGCNLARVFAHAGVLDAGVTPILARFHRQYLRPAREVVTRVNCARISVLAILRNGTAPFVRRHEVRARTIVNQIHRTRIVVVAAKQLVVADGISTVVNRQRVIVITFAATAAASVRTTQALAIGNAGGIR
jgi:hypothetical protein